MGGENEVGWETPVDDRLRRWRYGEYASPFVSSVIVSADPWNDLWKEGAARRVAGEVESRHVGRWPTMLMIVHWPVKVHFVEVDTRSWWCRTEDA